jgi:hypothetical protein
VLQRKLAVIIATVECVETSKRVVHLVALESLISASSSQHMDWTKALHRGEAPLRTVHRHKPLLSFSFTKVKKYILINKNYSGGGGRNLLSK